MFCKNCGRQVESDKGFCPECGAPLNASGANKVQTGKPINVSMFCWIAVILIALQLIFWFCSNINRTVSIPGIDDSILGDSIFGQSLDQDFSIASFTIMDEELGIPVIFFTIMFIIFQLSAIIFTIIAAVRKKTNKLRRLISTKIMPILSLVDFVFLYEVVKKELPKWDVSLTIFGWLFILCDVAIFAISVFVTVKTYQYKGNK